MQPEPDPPSIRSIVEVSMQSRPEPDSFGSCHECEVNAHDYCVGVPCSCACPSAPWVLFTTKERAQGGLLLWWRPEGHGYTRFFDEAGRFSRHEAQGLVEISHGAVVALPLSAAEGLVRKVVTFESFEAHVKKGIDRIMAHSPLNRGNP